MEPKTIMKTELQQIAVNLCTNEQNFDVLTETIQRYEALVSSLSAFNEKDEKSRLNIDSENGMALGTNWAAMCLDDVLRTQAFISAIFKAVEQVRKKKDGVVHILYAGSGPYATLLLPVLASYSADKVQCTLIEINPESFKNVQVVISRLGLDKHVRAFILEDATKIKLQDDADILVSETMQHGLLREQQVPITMNLLKQLSKDTILIPESINVTLGLYNSNSFMNEFTEGKEEKKHLETIVEFSKERIENEYNALKMNNGCLYFPLKEISLNIEDMKNFQQLVLFTDIQIFNDVKLELRQSGLTTPIILENLDHLKTADRSIKIRYVVDSEPRMDYSID